MPRKPGDECDQRRLVDIAPGKVLAAGHVVELVAKKAVVIDARKLNEQLGGGEAREQRRGADGNFTPTSQQPGIDLAAELLSRSCGRWEIPLLSKIDSRETASVAITRMLRP